MKEFNITVNRDESRSGLQLTAFLADRMCRDFSAEILTKVWENIAAELARQYVEKYGQEILAQIDQRALANAVLAQSANSIARSLVNSRF